MVTYYRDGALQISASELTVDDRRYPLASLEYVWHRRTGALRRRGYMLLSRGGLLVLAIVVLLAAGAAVLRVDVRDTDPRLLGGVALVVIALGAAAAFGVDWVLDLIDRTHEHGKGVHEIWARVEGRDILLFATTDALRFGKVYRSLRRAIEQTT